MVKLGILSILLSLFSWQLYARFSYIDAAKQGNLTVIQSLLSQRSPLETTTHGASPLHFACYHEYPAIVTVLLEYGISVNARTIKTCDFPLGKNLKNNWGGTTALMLAAYKGNMAIVKALLARGARINDQDDRGQTALHYAILGDSWPLQPISRAYKQVIQALLAAGANPRLQDEQGNDAIYYYSLVAALFPLGDEYVSDPDQLHADALYRTMTRA